MAQTITERQPGAANIGKILKIFLDRKLQDRDNQRGLDVYKQKMLLENQYDPENRIKSTQADLMESMDEEELKSVLFDRGKRPGTDEVLKGMFARVLADPDTSPEKLKGFTELLNRYFEGTAGAKSRAEAKGSAAGTAAGKYSERGKIAETTKITAKAEKEGTYEAIQANLDTVQAEANARKTGESGFKTEESLHNWEIQQYKDISKLGDNTDRENLYQNMYHTSNRIRMKNGWPLLPDPGPEPGWWSKIWGAVGPFEYAPPGGASTPSTVPVKTPLVTPAGLGPEWTPME